VRVTKRCAFAKPGHVGAQVVDPDVFGAVFFLILVCRAAFGEEQVFGLAFYVFIGGNQKARRTRGGALGARRAAVSGSAPWC